MAKTKSKKLLTVKTENFSFEATQNEEGVVKIESAKKCS